MGRKKKVQPEESTVITTTETAEKVDNEVVQSQNEAPGTNENNSNDSTEEEINKESVELDISNEEVFQGRISILEHTFDKKVIERGIYDLYQKNNMWIFKDRNGRELSTHFGELKTALQLFAVRMFPINKRTKGSQFTWSEVE